MIVIIIEPWAFWLFIGLLITSTAFDIYKCHLMRRKNKAEGIES